MNVKDALAFLGLPSTEYSNEDVESAYKKLALKHHPDKGGNNGDMASLNEARDTLIDRSSENSVPVIIKQFEVAMRDMNAISKEQKNIERKVEKIEKDIRNTATNKLRTWRQAALIFAALSTAGIFLGKDIPKEVLVGFQQTEIEKPAEIKKPAETNIILKYKKLNASKTVGKNTGADITSFSIKEKKQIEAYLKDMEAYDEYVFMKREAEHINANIKEKKRLSTIMWYTLTFGIGIFAGLVAWHYNHKIHAIESELSELNDELLIKSMYVKILNNIFKGEIPASWTLKTMENAACFIDRDDGSLKLICRAIGPKKFAQLLIVKGQESSFIKVIHGKADNNYEESYSIA